MLEFYSAKMLHVTNLRNSDTVRTHKEFHQADPLDPVLVVSAASPVHRDDDLPEGILHGQIRAFLPCLDVAVQGVS